MTVAEFILQLVESDYIVKLISALLGILYLRDQLISYLIVINVLPLI